MASFDSQANAVARVYAGAMLELAQKQDAADDLREELLELGRYLDDHAAFADFLASPQVDAEARKVSIEKIFRGRASDLLVDSIQVLNRKERLGILPTIIEAYRLVHDELRSRVDVYVTSAVALTDDQRSKVAEVARKQTGKEPQLVESVDPSIIGGMILRIGDEKFDSSVTTRLSALSAALLDRASREIRSGKAYVTDPVG